MKIDHWLWAYDEPTEEGNNHVVMTKTEAISAQRKLHSYTTDEEAFEDWKSVHWAYPIDGEQSEDLVNSPPHYRAGAIECIDAIRAALTPEEWRGYIKGNVIKYVWRERHKGGTESLRKAAWYLDRLIESEGDKQ